MNHVAVLEAFYEEIDRARWLKPDAELDAMGAPAMRYLEERFDEHVAAVSHWVAPADAAFSLTLWVTRSAREAAARWSAHWDPDGSLLAEQLANDGRLAPETFVTPPLPIDLQWREALQRCNESYPLREKALPRPHPSMDMLRVDLRPRLTNAALRSVEWRKPPPRYSRAEVPPFWAALRCARELCFRSLEPPDSAAPACPWRPLMAIWNRGGWPFALRGGQLGVFVPETRERGLELLDVDRTTRCFRGLPVVASLPHNANGLDPVTELLGFDFPAYTPKAVSDFRRP